MADILFRQCSVCHGWYVAPPEQTGPLICSECDHGEPELRPIRSVEITITSEPWWIPMSIIRSWTWNGYMTDGEADAAVAEADRIVRGESS